MAEVHTSTHCLHILEQNQKTYEDGALVVWTYRSRLKVWFIKNYMSPQMRAFVPHMASHYGFDFEFVTYKWPSWLHKQTEKQRIIWAYKILFLDVLFPLDLKKVIFLVRLHRTRGYPASTVEGTLDGQRHVKGKKRTGYRDLPVVKCSEHGDPTVSLCSA